MGGPKAREAATGSQIAAQCVAMWLHFDLLSADEMHAFYDCTGTTDRNLPGFRLGLTEAPPVFVREVQRINAELLEGREAYPLKT